MLTRAEREELKALSKEIFGVSSKYEIYTKGGLVLRTKEIEEEVPGENGAEPTKRKLTVPLLTVDGAKQYEMKKYSFEECKKLLLEIKVRKDEFLATMKLQQEEAQAKKDQLELQKKVNEQLSGSAI